MNKFIETHEFASKLKGSASFKADFRRKTFFVFFLLKSVLKSGPKWTRTTDLTLIRRAL